MVLILLTPIISIFTFIFGQVYMWSNNCNRNNIKKAHPLTPQNTIILFDLHGVIFKHDFKQMLLTFWCSSQKWQLMKDMLDPCLIWDILKLLYRRPIPESFFMHLAHNYKQIREVLPLLIRIANCQKVNPSVILVMKQLKAHGYELAMLSNIGQLIYTDLLSRHKEIFHLFDQIMVASPETHYASKPSPKIYELFLDKMNPTGKHVIMIDDKQKNLCGGLPFGIIGILYTNTPELKKKLTTLGIRY